MEESDDEFLDIAARDRNARAEAAKAAAVRTVLEEVSGELYAAAFHDTLREIMQQRMMAEVPSNEDSSLKK